MLGTEKKKRFYSCPEAYITSNNFFFLVTEDCACKLFFRENIAPVWCIIGHTLTKRHKSQVVIIVVRWCQTGAESVCYRMFLCCILCGKKEKLNWHFQSHNSVHGRIQGRYVHVLFHTPSLNFVSVVSRKGAQPGSCSTMSVPKVSHKLPPFPSFHSF